MTAPAPVARPPREAVVNSDARAVQPNRSLEQKLDRLMFGAITARPSVTHGLE